MVNTEDNFPVNLLQKKRVIIYSKTIKKQINQEN